MSRMAALAWKNIWRNKVRSGVVLGAIALGLFSGTFLVAFIEGWVVGTVNSDIETQYSHVQIHHADFLANYDMNASFMREEVEAKLKQSGPPAQMAFRLNLTGMLASPHAALGVSLKALWEEEEKHVTTLWKQTQGAYFNDDTKNAIVISQRTADKLKAKLKSKMVFTFQDVHGELQSIAFRVSGIYKTTNGMFDEANVFVRYRDIWGYTGLPPGAVHEAALFLSDMETSDTAAPQLKNMFPHMDVQDWRELNPSLALTLAFTDFMGLIIVGIFLLALSFGILNTSLMAVLERTRELGMLGAIGMSKGKMFSMVMLETVFLTLCGGIIGIVLGMAVLLPTLNTGINLSFFMGDQFEDFGFGSIIYPIVRVEMVVELVVLVMMTGILSSLYPARKALQLKPLEAIRKI